MGIGLWLLIGFVLYGLGIAAVLTVPSKMCRSMLAGFGVAGSLALLPAGFDALFRAHSFRAALWSIFNAGTITITADHLAGFFLIVTALVALPSSIFAAGQLQTHPIRHPKALSALYLALLIAIPLVIIAADIYLFLIAWESMSIIVYLIITSSERERSAYLMLAIGELGTLSVLIALLLMSGDHGSLTFSALKSNGSNLGIGLRWTVFLLSFFGFGIKAGLIPFNFWLPRAYTNAPSPAIPLIAGATLNLGLYGIIRINAGLLPHPPIGAGVMVLIIGSATALIGILYATIEDDLKTLLAHSSIENAGIITTALGAGFIFLATGHHTLAAMAFVAALYHLLNHSVFKTLLFMGSGAVEGAAGTRSLDRLGGLLKRMPYTGLFVLVAVLSISAMPPFNGFVSEWLTLQALLRSVVLSSFSIKIAFVTAGVGLALTAGLAVTCFVRAVAMGFLGIARSEAISRAHDASKAVLTPMVFLAAVCLLLGVLPTTVIPMLDRVVVPITGASGTGALVPNFFTPNETGSRLPSDFVAQFHNLGAQIGRNVIPGPGLVVLHRGGTANPVVFAMSTSYMFIMLLFLLAVSGGVVALVVSRRRKVERRRQWDGGVRDLLPEMTYTATGFAQPVRVIFEAILRPQVVEHRETLTEYFRIAIRRRRDEVYLIDRLVLNPVSAATAWISDGLARMHNGRVNAYAGYVLLALLLLLVIASFG